MNNTVPIIIIVAIIVTTVIIFRNFIKVWIFQAKKRQVYTHMIRKINTAMERIDVPCFLSSGTCLGFFREQDFIKHDYDIDIGIMQSDFTEDVLTEMENEGFELYRTLGTLSTGVEYSFRLPGTKIGKAAKVDIFVHYNEIHNNKKHVYWTSYKTPLFTEQIKYRVSDFNLKRVRFKGMYVNVPDPTLKYIQEHYGEKWMIPLTPADGYHYYSSPTSIVTPPQSENEIL